MRKSLASSLCGVLLTLTACTGGGTTAGSASNEVVVFMPSTSVPYLAQWAKGVEDALSDSEYRVRLVQSSNGQTEQDQQVQQILSSGTKPVAYLWWPNNNAAGVASMAALSRSGAPVVAVNQLPPPEADQYYAYYSGVNDVGIGQIGAENILAARQQLTDRGVPMHSPGGNLVAVDFGSGYGASIDRIDGLRQGLETSGVSIIDVQSGGLDQTAGFEAMSAAIPKNRAQGIDLVFATGDGVAQGVIQALEQAGYRPGEDVMVVGGNCAGEPKGLENGTQFASAVQGAVLEGQHTGLTLKRFLDNGQQVVDGDHTAEATPDAPPEAGAEVFRRNFIPTPPIDKAAIGGFRLWGYDFDQLCVY
ncbi:sugar ABC transporter substrate-binding protein [Mycolicibacterium sp.]|uniref:sugar ABC transporter substrate-binding protein n=1 Tax=Mycolicibacterium sp. TaxID=2320850 RepID=UPI003D1282BB